MSFPISADNQQSELYYNEVLPHRLQCHYLPRRLSSFSCSQCDDLRDRMLRRGGINNSAIILSSLHKRKQCQREQRGRSLVKVRVIIGWTEEGPHNMHALLAKKIDAGVESTKSDTRKKGKKLKAAKQSATAAMKITLLEQKERNAAAVKQALVEKQVQKALLDELTAKRIKNSKMEEKYKVEIASERKAKLLKDELLKQEKIMTKRLKTQTEYYRSRFFKNLYLALSISFN